MITWVTYLYSDENGSVTIWGSAAVSAVQAVITWTLSSALTDTGAANSQFGTTDWYYKTEAASGATTVTLIHSWTAIDTDPVGSGYTLTGLSSATITTQWVAAKDAVAGGKYSQATIEKDDLADYFKIGSNEEDLKVFKL